MCICTEVAPKNMAHDSWSNDNYMYVKLDEGEVALQIIPLLAPLWIANHSLTRPVWTKCFSSVMTMTMTRA